VLYSITILLGSWVFGNTNFTEKGLFVYMSSILENAIHQEMLITVAFTLFI